MGQLSQIFIFFTSVLFAQENQGSITFEEKIKLEIENPSSQYFYPNLLTKINELPESTSQEELKFLYYGQIYKKGSGLSFLDNPNEDTFRKAVMQKNCNKILKFVYLNLKQNPVLLTTLMPVCDCQSKIKATEKDYLNTRLKILIELILDTGNGYSKETAIKIANIEDDLLLKEILKFKDGKETFETLNNRTFSVWNNGIEKIYFEDSWNYKYN
ncbi:hypothetical protein FFWV33_16255 [Flavobacterium faecale]|uniref:DUF4919 domain-containing protein n=1 Tax=Flavobacterium faecale TaxID=1355330 RepID=A0A2S1LGY7_9FLAO|nr:DUF4919 domain-containing protein [Flavobacterium faecale]AWG22968.1 hypothetical protein FFWV33_16255 [Flavobacterium faecale]